MKNWKDILGKDCERELVISREAIADDRRLMSLSFSDETPAIRWWGIEILSHAPGAMMLERLNTTANLLVNHDIDKVAGVIESAVCDSTVKRGKADVRFGQSSFASEIYQDVKDGIRRNVSFRYVIHEAIELKPEEMTPELKDMAVREQMPVILVTRYEPMEISIVSVPQSFKVGVERGQSATQPDLGNAAETDPINISQRGKSTMEPTVLEKTPEQIRKEERERSNEIEAVAKRFANRGIAKLDEMKRSALDGNWTVEMFKGAIVDALPAGEPVETPVTQIGLTETERKGYRFQNAIRHLLGDRSVDAGFEIECSRAVSDAAGVKAKGILVPYDVLGGRKVEDFRMHPDFLQFLPKQVQRDLLTSSAASAGNLVGTNLLAGEFIEMLRNRMLLRQLGARVLTGLVGNLAIPRQTGAGTAVWETEGTGISSESTQTFDQVTMSPNEVGAYTEISRKQLLQSTPGIEGLIRDDLSKVLALAIDLAGFHGSGGTQPTGIAGTSGVGSVSGAGLTWDEVVEFWSDVASGNADVATMNFATNPTVAGVLLKRPIVAGYPMFLMGADFRMMNFPVGITNQISAGYLFFGDFSQVIIGEWGVLDLTVNPYVKDIEGLVRVTAHQAVDVGVRHAGAFSIGTGVN
jgi:HK97 family phage major capsid protein